MKLMQLIGSLSTPFNKCGFLNGTKDLTVSDVVEVYPQDVTNSHSSSCERVCIDETSEM